MCGISLCHSVSEAFEDVDCGFQLWLAASVVSSLFGYQRLLLYNWPPRVPLPERLEKYAPVI